MTAIPFLVILLASPPSQIGDDDIIVPADYAPCGLNSFYLVSQLLEVPLEWEEAKRLLGPAESDGTHSFQQMAEAAEGLGLYTVGLRTDVARLGSLPMPAVVHVRDPRRPNHPPHLLVLLRATTERVTLLDPPMPAYELPAEQFAQVWTGNVLTFTRDRAEARRLRAGAWLTVAAPAVLAVAAGMFLATLVLVRGRRSQALGRLQLESTDAAMQLAGVRRGVARWKKAAVVGALALGAGATAFLIAPRAAERASRCVLPETEFDLGERNPGTTTVEIPVRNGGTDLLKIGAVHSSCTCASVEAPAQIAPGGTAAIKAMLRVSRGRQRATLVIESNDPSGDKRILISWYGQFRPVLSPVRVAADFVSLDQPFEQTLRLIYPAGDQEQQPRLEQVECASPKVEVWEGASFLTPAPVQWTRTGRNIAERDLHMRIKPPAQPQLLETVCHLKVRQGGQTYPLRFTISVRFMGKGGYMPDATSVTFAATMREALVGQERVVRISTPATRKGVAVLGLPDWLTCDQRAEAGNHCRLLFRVVRAPEGAAVRHTVYAQDREDAAVRVPITIHCVTSQ